MKLRRAIAAGVLGAVLVYLIVLAAATLSSSHADLCLLIGASITGRLGGWSWLIGAVGQLIVAMVAAIVYAAIFEWVTRRGGAIVGFIIALGHVVVAGIAVGFMPTSRLIAADMAPPGAFMEYRGLLVIAAFILAHLAFGTSVGMLYGRTRHRTEVPVVVWRDVGA
jgi:hypothetical protein